MKKVYNIVIIIVALWGVSGFFASDILLDRAKKENKELPLSGINGIVVDNLGNIYVGLDDFGRVQVYNKNGSFIDSWDVEVLGGMFYLDISKDNNIIIYSERGAYKTMYNIKGEQFFKEQIPSIDTNIKKSQKVYMSSQGNEYKITGWLFPNIRKDGDIIIRQNVLLKSLTFPNTLVVSFFAMVLLIIINRKAIERGFRKIG